MIELRFAGDTLAHHGAPRQGRRLVGIGKLRHSVGALKAGVKSCQLAEKLFRMVMTGALLKGLDAFAKLSKRADDPAPVYRLRRALRPSERSLEANRRLADAALPQQLAELAEALSTGLAVRGIKRPSAGGGLAAACLPDQVRKARLLGFGIGKSLNRQRHVFAQRAVDAVAAGKTDAAAGIKTHIAHRQLCRRRFVRSAE